MDFSEIVSKWVEDTKKDIDSTLQTIVINIGRSVVTLSPVDTGNFKGNWQLSIGSGAGSSLIREDPSGAATLSDIESTARQFTAGQMAYIQNHVLYGYDLEYGTYNGPTAKVTDEGFSRQAPQGMVRITAAKFLRIVDEAVRLHSQ